MTRNHIYALVCILLCAGCANMNYAPKAGETREQYLKDDYDCRKDVRAAQFYGGILAIIAAQNFFKECMESKGYLLAQPDQTQQ